MSLIKCPECKKEISSKADTCPQCGFPISRSKQDSVSENMTKRKNKKLVIIISVVLFVAIIFVVGIIIHNAQPHPIVTFNSTNLGKEISEELYKSWLEKDEVEEIMDGQISDNTISKHYGIKTTEYVSLVDANGYIGKANFPMIIDQIQRYATFSTSDSLANNNFINIYSSYDELEKVSNKYYDDLIKEANKKYGKTEPNDIGVYEWKTDDFSYRINRNVSADHVQISESIFSRNR